MNGQLFSPSELAFQTLQTACHHGREITVANGRACSAATQPVILLISIYKAQTAKTVMQVCRCLEVT